MLLVSWLRDLRRNRRRKTAARSSARHRSQDVRLSLLRLEDRQVLSASALPTVDLGDVLSAAADTSLDAEAGSFSHQESIGNAADVDLYGFSADAGSRLVVNANGEEGTGTTLRLFDALGNELAIAPGDLDGQSGLDVTIAQGGQFFLGVSGAGNDAYDPLTGRGLVDGATGDYQLDVLLQVDAGTNGDPGTTLIDGFIGDAGLGHEVDLYRFEARAGTTLTATTSLPLGATDKTNTFLRLFDADGNQLSFDDDDGPGLYSQLEFEFTSSGTYLIGVSAFPNIYYDPADGTGTFEGDKGEYRLSLNFDAGGTLETAAETGLAGASAEPFSVVETLGGPNRDADVDLFRFEANVGDELAAQTFAVAGSANPDTMLRLFDADGNELAANDDIVAGIDRFSRLEFTFTVTGMYFIGVSGFPNDTYDPVTGDGAVPGSTGDYRLAIALSGPPATVTGTVFRDENGDGTNDGEPGLAGVTVFVDENQNGQLDGVATVSSTDVPVAIPDGDDGTPVTSDLTISGVSGTITDVDVTLDISHTFVSDLDIFLISPDGTRVLLVGVDDLFDFGGEDFVGTTFDDDADVSITDEEALAPFTGRFQPSELLSLLNGESPNGTWQLEIADQFEFDTGTLNSWSIIVTTTDPEPFTLTDAAGNYTLTDLQPGTHTVAQITPADHVQTFPPAAAPHVVTVGPGETVGNVDFGNQPIIGEIRGTKFEDLNEDGVRDEGEPGIAGVTIFLDQNGNSQFDGSSDFDSTDVPQSIISDQTITSTINVGGLIGDITDINLTLDITHDFVEDLDLFLISPDGTRVALALGSNFDIFGQDLAATTFDDEALQSITFAFEPYTGSFRPVGSLANFDGEDPNGTWTLEITDTFFADDGFLNDWSLAIGTTDAEPFAVTDASGNYAFTGLDPGTYVVREVPQINFVQTFPSGDGSHTVDVDPGEVVTGIDFGNRFGFAEIRGTVFEDLDADGLQSAGEAGIENALVLVDLNQNGLLDALPTVIASADVPAPITDLATTVSSLNVSGLNGEITDIDVTLDIAHTFNGDLDIFLVNPSGDSIALAFGFDLFGANLTNTTFDDEAFDSIAFGDPPYVGSFQPSDFLSFFDGEDPNGIWQLIIEDTAEFDEGVLNSWSLSITTSQPDTFEPFAFTDDAGNYTIGGISPGTHTVLQFPPAGFRQVSAFDFFQQVTLGVDEQLAGIDFGNQQTATITGIKFEDQNANGVQDPGEPGLGGFFIQAFDDFGNFLGGTFTDSDGSYFLEVLPGRVTVSEFPAPGFEQTFPSLTTLTAFDFESGAQGFVASGEWHLSLGRAFDGGHSANASFYFGSGESADGGGVYASISSGSLVSPVINLAAGAPAQLTFNHFLDVEDFFDSASVLVVSNGGQTRTLIADNNGTAPGLLPDFTFGFEPFTLDLSAFAGQQIQIEFAFTSDSSVEFEGWYVDDVTVSSGSAVYDLTVLPGEFVTGIDFGNRNLDAIGDDFFTAEPLALVADGTVSRVSSIDQFGDQDVFEVVAPQTGFLAVGMTGLGGGESGSFLDPFVRVFEQDQFGNFVFVTSDDDSAGFPDSLAAFEAVAGQRFFIEASDFFDGGIGDYELTVTSTGPAQPLALNEVAPGQFTGVAVGNLVLPEQVQVFEVTMPAVLPAGSQLTLALDPAAGSGLDPLLLVFDPSGLRLDDDALQFNTRVFGGETFLAVALGNDGTFGSFRLSATIDQVADDFGNDLATATNLGTLADGVPLVQVGSIESDFDVDAFLIQAPAGQSGSLTIDLVGVGGFDTVLEVTNLTTGDVSFNDDVDFFGGNLNSQLVLGATGGEQFLVLARGFFDSVGEYTLTATFAAINDDFGNSRVAAGVLGELGTDFAVDEPVRLGGEDDPTGSIQFAGDVDFFEVLVPTAGTLQIRQNAVAGGTLDPFVRVFDDSGNLVAENGNLLAANDDVGFADVNGEFTFSLDSLVALEVVAGQTIFVQAGAFGTSTGDYDLIFSLGDDFPNELGNASEFNLGPGIQHGEIEAAGDNDVFRFTASTNERLRIEVAGTALASSTFASTDVPQAIPDDGGSVDDLAVSELAVSGVTGTVADINVTLDLSHTFNEDLDIFLVSPSGTRIQLVNGLSLDDFDGNGFSNTTFDDQAATSINTGTAPYTGSFRPAESLGTLNGENANGIWQLEIGDFEADDVGTLNTWSITLLTPTGTSPADFNPVVTVFQEFDTGKFREVARRGDDEATSSQVDLFVQSGDEYVVRVAEFGTGVGTYELSVTPTAGAEDIGDTFADAELIFDPALPNLGLDPAGFEITAGDVDIFRFVAQTTGTATFAAPAAVGGGLIPRLAAFEFIADPAVADNVIPQQIASNGAGSSVSFSVVEGQQYAVRISGGELAPDTGVFTTGTYAPQLNVAPGVVDATFAPLSEAGAFVFTDVRQALLTLSSTVTDRSVLANQLIAIAVNTFTSSTSFDPTQTYLIMVLDPVDNVLSEGSAGPSIGFDAGSGQINEIPGGFHSGDGVVEVLILPTSAQSFNSNFSGLGSDFLFQARLLTPGGPEGGLVANITNSDGTQFSTGAFNNSLLGSLSVVLDFSGTPNGGGTSGGATDVGLAFALAGLGTNANGNGLGVSLPGLAFSDEAAQAIQQLQQAAAALGAASGEIQGWDRVWETVRITQAYVQNVLDAVGEWVGDNLGVQDAVEYADSSLLPENVELLLKKRQWLWSSLGAQQSPLTPMKLFFQLREAVDRFSPALLRATDEPAEAAPVEDAGTPTAEAGLQPAQGDVSDSVADAAPGGDDDAAGADEATRAALANGVAAVTEDRPAARLLRARPRLTRLFR